ncbi:MAG: phosphodiester glycosidase family protein [Sumerlaeia bacterium]
MTLHPAHPETLLNRHMLSSLHLGPRPLDRLTVEGILGIACQRGSFERVEDEKAELCPGVTWRRRRLGWTNGATGEDEGLCVNELRVRRNCRAQVRPSIAMTNPGLVDFEAIDNAYWQTVWAAGAIRIDRGEKIPRLFVNMRNLVCARPGAPRGPWEDLLELQRAIESDEFDFDNADNYACLPELEPRLSEGTTTGDIRVARFLPAFPPSWSVQADGAVHAATNAGYFLNFPEEYEDDGLSALHQPIGALFADGQLQMPPWIERPAAIEWKDGERRIELLGPSDIALSVNGEAPYRLVLGIDEPHAAATVWRHFDGPLPDPRANWPEVDLVFCGAGLVHPVRPGEVQPPLGGAIVRLAGDIADPWLSWLDSPKTGPREMSREAPFPRWRMSLLTSRANADLDWVVSAGPKLLNDGRVISGADMLAPWAAGEFHAPDENGVGPAPTRFPYETETTRAPRTAIGISGDGEWVLAVIDGRADMTHSVGMSLSELARLMARLGCRQAMNLDGGGSSVMCIEGLSPMQQLRPGLAATVANIPSDTGHRERIVPVALMVVDRIG